MKSNEEVTHLVHDIVLHPDFTINKLLNFNATCENKNADAADHESTFLQAFQEIAVKIEVPSGSKDIPVIIVYSLITVPTALLCQRIAPEGVSLFSIA